MTDPTDFAVASALYEALCGITGEQNALRYSQRFLPLTAEFHAGLRNYEGMAFYAYTTALAWHEKINAELWSGHPSAKVQFVRDILTQALDKLPVYKLNGGTVYRGYRTHNLDGFLRPYRPDATVHFPGFTSAAFKEDGAFGGNVLFIIRALTAKAVWYLAADFGEYEVLIPAGRSFVVRDVERVANRAVITMDEIR